MGDLLKVSIHLLANHDITHASFCVYMQHRADHSLRVRLGARTDAFYLPPQNGLPVLALPHPVVLCRHLHHCPHDIVLHLRNAGLFQRLGELGRGGACHANPRNSEGGFGHALFSISAPLTLNCTLIPTLSELVHIYFVG